MDNININIALLEHALEVGKDNIGPHMDAIAIALMKNFLTQEDLRVGNIRNFSKKFGSSSKRLLNALKSDTGKKILSYDEKRGMLHTGKIAGIGYNAPFIVVEDKVFSYQDRLNKRMVVEHTKNADVKIPIKESLKSNISYVRKQLHIAVTMNHLIKSIRMYNTWIEDINSDIASLKDNISRYSTGSGLYEGVSVERMAKINRLPKRTMERILSELLELKIIRPLGRHERIKEFETQAEAYSALIDLRKSKAKGCYYVSKNAVFKKLSNRYEMVSTTLLPRFHKIKSETQKEKKNQKPGTKWEPKYGDYKWLPTYYGLNELLTSDINYSAPDIDGKTGKRRYAVFETTTNKNEAVLRGNVKVRLAPYASRGIREAELKNAQTYTYEPMTEWEFVSYEHGILFPLSIHIGQYFREVLNPQIEEMAKRMDIPYEKARQIRYNTQGRLEARYHKLLKQADKEAKEKGTKRRVIKMRDIIDEFNSNDKKIQDQFPMTYIEYIADYRIRNKHKKPKYRNRHILKEIAPGEEKSVSEIEGYEEKKKMPVIPANPAVHSWEDYDRVRGEGTDAWSRREYRQHEKERKERERLAKQQELEAKKAEEYEALIRQKEGKRVESLLQSVGINNFTQSNNANPSNNTNTKVEYSRYDLEDDTPYYAYEDIDSVPYYSNKEIDDLPY